MVAGTAVSAGNINHCENTHMQIEHDRASLSLAEAPPPPPAAKMVLSIETE